ncbi:hypothetical protein CH06BL_21740 [Chromobacterium haemolyticum]|nr:hypothetical protein CH06BL_21740 [Chromobacterium haemolyticum]
MDIRRDGWQFFGLPQPCEVWINNQHYEVEDGALEINLPQPGLYQVRLSAWPYRDVELKLEVTG